MKTTTSLQPGRSRLRVRRDKRGALAQSQFLMIGLLIALLAALSNTIQSAYFSSRRDAQDISAQQAIEKVIAEIKLIHAADSGFSRDSNTTFRDVCVGLQARQVEDVVSLLIGKEVGANLAAAMNFPTHTQDNGLTTSTPVSGVVITGGNNSGADKTAGLSCPERFFGVAPNWIGDRLTLASTLTRLSVVDFLVTETNSTAALAPAGAAITEFPFGEAADDDDDLFREGTVWISAPLGDIDSTTILVGGVSQSTNSFCARITPNGNGGLAVARYSVGFVPGNAVAFATCESGTADFNTQGDWPIPDVG